MDIIQNHNIDKEYSEFLNSLNEDQKNILFSLFDKYKHKDNKMWFKVQEIREKEDVIS